MDWSVGMGRTMHVRVAVLVAVTIAVCLTSSIAGAQDFRENRVRDTSLLEAGRMELGLNLAGAISFGSVSPDGGESVSQTNVYVAPSLIGGYMVTDNIEVRLALGGQYIRQSQADTVANDNWALTGALQGLYQADLFLGLGLYGGLGIGGFWGQGSQALDDGTGLQVGLTNTGVLGQLLAGLLMQPGPHLLLRGGLRVDLLYGFESPQVVGVGVDSSFFTTQILFEVAIGWRLG